VALLDEQMVILENGFGKQTQKIDYYINTVNQFVENGYEVHHDTIELKEWWNEKKTVYYHKIYFKRDYSSRPLLFFVANKLKHFSVKNLNGDELKRNVIISIDLVKLMTTYFTIEVTVEANEKVEDGSVNKTFIPSLEVYYVVLNRNN
jgi:hypothetical protein